MKCKLGKATKILGITATIVVLAIVFTACKKDSTPEPTTNTTTNTNTTTATKTDYLCQTWKLSEYFLNNVKQDMSFINNQVTFTANGKFSVISVITINGASTTTLSAGNWNLISNDQKLITTVTEENSKPIQNPTPDTLQLIKLEKTVFWFKETSDTTTHESHYVLK